jgi:hypothetical protein
VQSQVGSEVINGAAVRNIIAEIWCVSPYEQTVLACIATSRTKPFAATINDRWHALSVCAANVVKLGRGDFIQRFGLWMLKLLHQNNCGEFDECNII